jgi:tyrosinase
MGTKKRSERNVATKSVNTHDLYVRHVLTLVTKFQGYQPYWNWFTYQDNLRASPIFDGSDTSMGSDGAFVKHNGSVGGAGKVFLPSGQGGGCITGGPFKVRMSYRLHKMKADVIFSQGLQTNLGPNSPTMAGEVKVTEKFVYNPRCLKRDLVSPHLQLLTNTL